MWFAVMNKFMQELDQRFLDTQKEKKKHTPERKVRISGSLLASFPPQAPKWTISKDWLKGMCRVCLFVLISAESYVSFILCYFRSLSVQSISLTNSYLDLFELNY